MRKIERAMLEAVKYGQYFSRANTEVRSTTEAIYIFLHGNVIAKTDESKQVLVVNDDTISKYPTRLTASRLRALGFNAQIVQGVLYVHPRTIPIPTSEYI